MTMPTPSRNVGIIGTFAVLLLLFAVLVPGLAAQSDPSAGDGAAGNGAGEAELFRFSYREGEQYRILSQVDQVVSVNGMFSHRADILNRISVSVNEVAEGRGFHSVLYQHSSERSNSTGVYEYGEDYSSDYWRDARGRYDIAPEEIVPVVIDVPVFPEDPLEVGETWVFEGKEIHDLFPQFGEAGIVTFPIPVTYEYLGERDYKDTSYPAFSVQYNVFYRPEARPEAPIFATLITGQSDQVMYWDPDFGRPHAYEEDYYFQFSFSDGRTMTFEGSAEAEVVESTPLDKERVTEEIQKDLEELDVPDTDVRSDERGVTITLQDIQFPPDSAFLRDSEKNKLDRIGDILRRYPERDILITGHTALAGTAQGRQQLSEQRAAAVGQYLLETEVRDPSRLLYRGMGAREPIADNGSVEGMRRNRRVEITILEN